MEINPAHWHLLVNHLPITGSIIGLLLLAYGILGKNQSVIKASYWLMVLLAIFSFIASQTGEGAEHLLKEAKLADQDIIEAHVKASEYAQYILFATAIAALAALFFKRLRSLRAMPYIVFILLLFGAVSMVRTGWLGGVIMHKEIRTDSTSTAAPRPA